LWDKLDISLDVGIVSNNGLVGKQSLVKLVQKELVVGGGGSGEGVGWVVETVGVVGVWKEVLVLQEHIIDQGLESENILVLAVD